MKLPSDEGWIKIHNLPIDQLSFDTSKLIGDLCSGYVETSRKTLARMNLMEVNLKVKKNKYGFLPAIIQLPLTSTLSLNVIIDHFFNQNCS